METRLKELREDSDLTQEKLARRLYISKNSLIRYERGERVMPLDVAVKVSELFKVSIDYIVKK